MKRILTYMVLSLAAALSLSCVRESLPEKTDTTEGMLTFCCVEHTTKAGISGTASDDPTWNEDLISTLDVYMYPAGGTDSDALWHRRYSPGVHTTHGISVNFTRAEIGELFPASNYCVVYAIANVDESVLPSTLSGTSIPNLKNILLPLNKFGSVAGTSHIPSSFVMDGQSRANLRETGFNGTVVADGTVPLYRIAAKMSLMIHVPDTIHITTTYKEDQTVYPAAEIWEPMSGLGATGNPQVEAYLEYGNAVCRIGVQSEPGTYLVNTTTASSGEYSSFSYKKNRMQYMSNRTTTVTEEERYTWSQHLADPDNITKDMVGTTTGTSTDVVYMISDPAFTYPMTWTEGADTEPFFKLVLPWKRRTNLLVYKNGWNNAPEEVVGKSGQKQYYYKIILPNDEILSNNWYQYKINIGILGSETDDAKVYLNPTYMVADWQNKSEVLEEAEVGNARYLSVAQEAYTLYNETTLAIPYVTSDDCEIVDATYTKPYYGTSTSGKTQINGKWYYTGTASSAGATINCSNGTISFEHALNNNMGANIDVAPYTFTFTIRHSSDHNYYKQITIYQYPGIYMSEVDGGSAFVDGYFAQVYGATMTGARAITDYTYNNITYSGYYTSLSSDSNQWSTTADGNVTTPYLNLYRRTVPQSFSLLDITRLTVTAFVSGSNTFIDHSKNSIEYIIGDPRTDSGWSSTDLANYLSSITGTNTKNTTSWGEKAGKIKIGDPDNTAIIAPSILFASAWSAKSGNVSFEQATKRCATYQEAGYPAGRWRLPTEAEVNFVQSLQTYNQIPTLFASGSDYWTCSGYTYNGSRYQKPSNAIDSGVRCVYDVWYWGDKAMSISAYHPEPE